MSVEREDDGLGTETHAAFIERWRGSGGMETANTQSFFNELCDLLGLDRPDPSKEETALNSYVFERQVTRDHADGTKSVRRIDLYKRGAFVLEAKQGSDSGGSKKADPAQADLLGEEAGKARAGTAKRGTQGWITAMRKARAQAEQYAKDLPKEHGWPPFVIVADIGYCFEIYADFFLQGKYEQFPDRRGFRVLLEDLHDPDIRARLRAIWTDPLSLDPNRKSAEATRDIAARLARVAKLLEKQYSSEEVAQFLMRCLFAMFAEDAKLLKEGSFTALLGELKSTPDRAHIALEQVFREMNTGAELSGWLREPVRRFNGGLFKDAKALKLTAEMVSELHVAAKKNWKEVEPAIFGTLLEQALNPKERHQLGAHYTPRAYVERLIGPTIMEPLREDWAGVQAEVKALLDEDKADKALARLRAFHAELCEIRVLDPACGTGNFLYVAMERMKRLEGEVVDYIVELGGEAALEFQGHTVDPHQFLGIELNPRAAAIAELVLWIGFIQWQLKTGGQDIVRDPVLRDFHNIDHRDAVLDYRNKILRTENGKPVTRWDGETYKLHPVTGERVPDESARKEIHDYENPRAADWPACDFIVGNPPFIGGKDIRAELGDGYAEALWAAHPKMPRSADFVMYWWHHAADRLARAAKAAKGKTPRPRRFGFITTNSIRQTFNRRVIEQAMAGKPPLSIVFAIPDHPWMKSADKAAVRIAMTVADIGEEREGVLAEVTGESGLNTDAPKVELEGRVGVITPTLRIGAAVSSAKALKANQGLGHKGCMPYGMGFVIDRKDASNLFQKDPEGFEKFVHPYVNGRDLTAKSREVLIIDFYGISENDAARAFPSGFQRLLERVKPEREQNNRPSYREKWWIFAEPRSEMRKALKGVKRYVATTETAKHRTFQLLDSQIVPDQKVRVIAADSAWLLSLLSSSPHVAFAEARGNRQGVGNDPVYTHSTCFDPFPFPDLTGKPELKAQLDELGERLDAFRKERLARHDFLTMTKLYNVLERVRELEGAAPPSGADAPATSPAGGGGKEVAPLTDAERDIYEAGLVGVLKDIHDRIDRCVFEAYGWPADLSEEDILTRLVALNHERTAEEAQGVVRWLRPEFQNPEGKAAPKPQQSEILLPEAAKAAIGHAKLPDDKAEQARLLRAALVSAPKPLSAKEAAALFAGNNTKAKIGRVDEMLSILAAIGQAETTDDGRYFAKG